MSTLYVAWQQPDSKEWIPVARLDHSNGKYRFRYTRGVHRAREFQPFSRMDKIDATYESETLFPLFANRLISRSRPEFKTHLRWLGLSDALDDSMSMLALTGGIRGTDSLELFQLPLKTEDGSRFDFFARSLSFLPKSSIELINDMKCHSSLYLMNDPQNTFDSYALALRNENPTFLVGYFPKYYSKDISLMLKEENVEVRVHVKCVNVDAPLNMRLLCALEAKHPESFYTFGSSVDFQTVANTVPSAWEDIDLSVQ